MRIPNNELISGIVGALTAFAAAIAFLFANFETVDASNQRWAEHNQAIICETVNDLKMEKRRLETRLQFDHDMTAEQRKFVKEQLKEIKDEIDKKDPRGVC